MILKPTKRQCIFLKEIIRSQKKRWHEVVVNRENWAYILPKRSIEVSLKFSVKFYKNTQLSSNESYIFCGFLFKLTASAKVALSFDIDYHLMTTASLLQKKWVGLWWQVYSSVPGCSPALSDTVQSFHIMEKQW